VLYDRLQWCVCVCALYCIINLSIVKALHLLHTHTVLLTISTVSYSCVNQQWTGLLELVVTVNLPSENPGDKK